MNKQIISMTAIFSIIMGAILGCSKDDNRTTDPTETTNIYIAGYEQNNSINQAKIWKNGTATTLGVAGKASAVRAVFVSGKDVYVAGQEAISTATSSNRQIKLWKNGVLAQTITNGTQDAVAVDLQVVGNDVYIAGYEFSGTNNVVKVWKNGVASSLTDGTNEAIVEGMTIVDGNVYLTGYEFGDGMFTLKLWKNGVAQNLTSAVKSAEANALFVSNTDVYVAGEETGAAKFWKNGVATIVASKRARGTGILVTGNDVYVIFEEYNADTKKWQGKLWKNGQISNISNGTQDCYLKDITVEAGNIYVVGSESNGTKDVAKVWKNGTPTNLTNGTEKAIALGIAVAKH